MFLALLVVTLLTALLVSFLVARIFSKPLGQILGRLVTEDLSAAWHRYLIFAIYVVGVSGGVRIWAMERYIMPQGRGEPPLVLNGDRWMLEIYQTIIGTMRSTAWMLLVFFVFALIAYVIVRGLEQRAGRAPSER